MKLPVVDEAIKNKRVLVRGDIDIPIDQIMDKRYEIKDDTRLKAIWPTVEYLLKNGAEVILCGHLGRPGGQIAPQLSTKPVAEWIRGKIETKDKRNEMKEWKTEDGKWKGWEIAENFILLENLRFDPREEANDEGYAQELAGLADIYVNEAFAESHREVASIVGVPKHLPHFAGFRLAKEVEVLSGVLENPKRPLVVIIGGAKSETKLPLIDKMINFADTVMVGGLLADEIKDNRYGTKVSKIELGKEGKDATVDSIFNFQFEIFNAGTIIWNGPLGEIETGHTAGTEKLIELILANKSAYKIVGGGDTVGFVHKLGLRDKFDWVSSGGGSMLQFLAEGALPGLVALTP